MVPQAFPAKLGSTGHSGGPLSRAIDSFLSDLKRNEDAKSRFYREVLTQYSTALVSHTTEHDITRQCAHNLETFIHDLEQQQRAKSKTLRIANKLAPLITGLWQYTKAFDVVIQAAPAAATVLYGGARLLLQLAYDFNNSFSTVLDIMARIGRLLDCYELFSVAYPASVKIQDLLVESYKHIVRFWQKAAHLFSRKGYKTFLTGIVKPLDAEWQRCQQDLRRDCDDVRTLSQATEADIRMQKDSKTENGQLDESRRQVVDWLKAAGDQGKLDVRNELETRAHLQHPGTCQWLFENDTFKDWKNSSENSMLWYHGPPGSGKSVLCSTLLKHLQSQGSKTACFFFSFNDPLQGLALTAIRSLSLQLLRQLPDVPQVVMDIYKEEISNHATELRVLDTAIKVLKALLKRTESLYVILDGLDECNGDEFAALRDSFGSLMTYGTYGLVKWFYSSRQEAEVRMLSKHIGAREIAAPRDLVVEDIKKYLREQPTEKAVPTECSPIGCVDHLAQYSDGNFLWMKLMLRVIQGFESTCEDEMLEEMSRFPKDLNGCYLRSLQRLSARPRRHQDLARQVPLTFKPHNFWTTLSSM